MSPWPTTADHRTVSLRDSVVAFWVVLWLTMGVLTGLEIWSLSRVSDAAAASGRAADQAGRGLQELSALPLVPDGPGRIGDEVRAAADEIDRSAALIRQDVRRLSLLLGVSVALLPTVPVLALYLPGRLRWRRDVQAVRRELARAGRTERLDAYLAQWAVADLGWDALSRVSDDPAGDLAEGRYERLAGEQLRRLGIAPPRRAPEAH